ncbi:hypothetical protein ANCCAN_04819 [Ancylostoma caninum]|uniref:Uncharacterized protein n=1 Tax=Ancylostoma caninum TaxID=29170 RepID=A0A368GXM1_ANCCA|nr:hypothetical protein ANCCAN_04819 [Ancylostoma caninum]
MLQFQREDLQLNAQSVSISEAQLASQRICYMG